MVQGNLYVPLREAQGPLQGNTQIKDAMPDVGCSRGLSHVPCIPAQVRQLDVTYSAVISGMRQLLRSSFVIFTLYRRYPSVMPVE